MSNGDSQHQGEVVNVVTRKRRRGLIEKRRRDKINNSLTELRRLVPAAFEKQGSAKLEKAEILQMTVDYLRMLHARGLADSLTHNKESSLSSPPCDQGSCIGTPQETNNRPSSLYSFGQAQGNQYQTSSSSMCDDVQQTFSKQTATSRISQQQQHSNSILSSPRSSPINHANTVAVAAAASIIPQTGDISSRHLYSQHQQMLAEQAYHHHLTASGGGTLGGDMMSVIGHHHGVSTGSNHIQHPHHNHHSAQQAATSIIKQPSVIAQNHSHTNLLNLDNQHSHHGSSVHGHHHHHHHQLSVRYGHHPASINPYLAAYPAIQSNHVTSYHQHHPNSISMPSGDPIHVQQSRVTNFNDITTQDQSQPQLTQLDTRSPNSLNDSNSHQVSSSSSPSHSTSDSSAASAPSQSQRHYRPWGTGLAY